MALAECEDCGGKVSMSAPACPHCGKPFGGAFLPPKVLTERTSKPLKTKLAMTSAIATVGIVACCFGAWAFGLILVMVAAVAAWIIRAEIWWHHE